MKKFLAMLLAIGMIATMPMSALAVGCNEEFTKTNSPFNIIERVDENNRVIRVFERKDDDTSRKQNTKAMLGSDKYKETKELLLALGMEQDFIDNLSDKDLEDYSRSPKMCSSVSYTKYDEKNDTTTYLDEADALKESQAINKDLDNKIKNAVQLKSVDVSKQKQDSYMRIFYLVTYLDDGNGGYRFSTDARWLTMPKYRGKDSIGSCAQNCTYDFDTKSSWVEVDVLEINHPGIGNRDYRRRTNPRQSAHHHAINGSFTGVGVILDIPSDNMYSNGGTYYRNYKVHYQYDGSVNYPNSVSNFNTIGTYDHSTFGIGWNPSLSIDSDGVSGSIGLDVKRVTKARSVNLSIHYPGY